MVHKHACCKFDQLLVFCEKSHLLAILVFLHFLLYISEAKEDFFKMDPYDSPVRQVQGLGSRFDGASSRTIISTLIAARAPCDVFDPWVRWERGQVGI